MLRIPDVYSGSRCFFHPGFKIKNKKEVEEEKFCSLTLCGSYGTDLDPQHWIFLTTDRNGILYLGLGKNK
jgi:hypothetical protein